MSNPVLANARLTRQTNGTLRFAGLETGDLEVWHREGAAIIVKESGHHYWSGRFSPSAYAGAQYHVFTVDREGANGDLWLKHVASFPVKKKEGR